MRNVAVIIISFLFCLAGLHAQITEIPDPIFEQYLIDFGYDTDQTINGQVLTSDIDWIDFLQINETPPQYDIADFTGIEDFASLETFIANFTSISFINFGNLLELTYIEMISHPNLTSVDLSGLANLETFCIGGTNLEFINLPNSNTLNSFNCHSGNLTTLDLSQFSNLTFVGLSNNSLTSLNVANGNNINITNFSTFLNPDLVCILVDDIAYSEENWTSIEPITEFVDDIEDCTGLLSVATPALAEVSVFPNPAKDFFQVNGSISGIKEITLFDLSGKLVKKMTVPQQQYPIDGLTSGLYVIKIETDSNSLVKKLIIE